MIVDPRKLAKEGDSIVLEPFRFWPDLSSRILPLGGSNQGADVDYAFHTLYAAGGGGWIDFDIGFEDLQADRGTLILRIHELDDIVGANARPVALSQTQMIELIRGGGTVRIGTESRSGATYAVLGHIHGDCVVQASALGIEMVRRCPDPQDIASATRFQSDRIGAVGQLVGGEPPTLRAPVSQLCTESQFDEPIFKDWASHLSGTWGRRSIALWERVFIARVLDRYDVARAGARGLGVGGVGDSLSDIIGSAGCRLVLTAPTDESATLPVGATFQRLDPHDVSDGLSGFDFCYATSEAGPRTDRQGMLRFMEDLLRGLKPGGLGVFVVPVDVIGDLGDDMRGLHRGELDRIALVLLSRGHQVAQLRHVMGIAEVEDGRSSFGFIVRKAG